MNIKNKKGFTLIELIVVIVLLGILAIVALPRFATLTTEANAAVIEDLAGSLMSAAQIQHSKAIVNSANGGLLNGYVSDGILFDQGYPLAASLGDTDSIPEILEAMDIDLSGFTYKINFHGTGSAGNLTRELYITTRKVIDDGATTAQIIATGCYVSYASHVYVALPAEVVTNTNGC